MATTSASHHVQAIIDLLEAAPDADWTPTQTPTVKRYWDDAQSERGPGADMPAILYVWSPTTSSLDRFSMDGDVFDQNDSIEVQAWSFDETEVEQLQGDIVQILSEYLDDNEVQTPYSDVAPTGTNDFREQTPARTTGHYIMSVEVETRGLSETAKNA
ncbi:SPP1 gp17-like tail completion protein [Haloferax tailed virus 1]|uniref:SPP1 gp17-like tail completion protein n=1 Tax=Haloferax tailed virus 1 TaxID=2507575 RepID=A0A410N6U9_HFTV1|nr:SPP1 gp17-like tail completion protein [Haloferax tailed virus 1]QAS68862.1 SPP1 gp17-like tail completion protein [Haloferax tailed virus 1]